MTLCVYCGLADGTTRDHVPPRNLFSKPRPSNLVTVPCCEACRTNQSMDDEYFIRMLLMRHDVASHPDADKVLEKVHRSFLKLSKKGFTRSLINSVKSNYVRTKTGIYLGTVLSYDVDFTRLDNVISRVTKGLFFKEYCERLPDTHDCVAYTLAGVSGEDPAVVSTIKQLVQRAMLTKPRVFGANVFAYWLLPVESHTTVWFYLVYGKVTFLAFTAPKLNINSNLAIA